MSAVTVPGDNYSKTTRDGTTEPFPFVISLNAWKNCRILEIKKQDQEVRPPEAPQNYG